MAFRADCVSASARLSILDFTKGTLTSYPARFMAAAAAAALASKGFDSGIGCAACVLTGFDG